MNAHLRIIVLSSLALVMLIGGACNLITKPNTSFNFGSLDDADEWLEEHIWAIGVVVSEAEDKSSMILNPAIKCYQNGVVSYNDDYQLWINDIEIPLEVYGSTSNPRVRINWDLIHGNLSVPHSNKIHCVFHIDGIEEVNKIVLNPSTPVFDPFDFENVDFSSPVVVSWSLRNNANLQVLNCGTAYWMTDYASVGYNGQYFVETNRRNYTLDIDAILAEYSHYSTNPTTDNLTIDYFKLRVYNFEEDGFNAVMTMKSAEIGEVWKTKSAKTSNTPIFPWDDDES